MIEKEAYYSTGIFEEENRLLFRGGFQFAALTSELDHDRDFVSVDHFGQSVVIQNFKGDLKAFQNVCTHRFNKIQTEPRGNRALTCRYHGWSFDRTGFPSGMPKRDQFLSEDNRKLCLTEYEVQTCGKFVFIREEGEGSLEEHLGEFYSVLQDLSSHIGAEIHFCHVPHAANWKLLVENVLECYHCATVHKDTFVPLGVGRLPIDQVLVNRGHSSSHFPRVDDEREVLRQRYLSHLKERGMVHNSFYHIHIFPNLFISSGEGLSFYVGHALPLAADQTLLRMRIFEPAVELSPKHRARQEPINEGTVSTSMALIEEDRAILENIQNGIRISDKPGQLGAEEVRIKAFQETYRRRMRGAFPAQARQVRRTVSSI